MELDITNLFHNADPVKYSASRLEMGRNAGPNTRRAANDDSGDYPLLRTEEQREAFRSFVKDSGGWTEEEIAAWSDTELNALCIQRVSGDIRESGLEPDCTSESWDHYYSRASNGKCSGRLTRGDDGKVYFYIGS